MNEREKQYFRLNACFSFLLLFLAAIHLIPLRMQAQTPPSEQVYRSEISPPDIKRPAEAPDKRLARARELLRLQQPDAVIDLLEKTAALERSGEIYGLLGHAYYAKSIIKHERETPINSLFRYMYQRRSIEYFTKAMKSAPQDLSWPYGLATLYITKNDDESLRKAADLLLGIQSKNDKYLNVPFLLGLVYRGLDELEKSELTFEEFLKSRPDPMTMLEMVELNIRKNDIQAAEKYYLSALEHLDDDPAAVKSAAHDVIFLFSPDERLGFARSGNKGKWLRRFWAERDPTPRTKENERLREHLRRVAYAAEHFNSPGSRDRYDARGEIYIKYGNPSYRYQDAGNHNIYQNETWTYDWQIGGNRDGLVFDFANDPGFGFKMVTDLREAFPMAWNVEELQGLYRDRQDVNIAYYALLANSPDMMDFYSRFHDMQYKKLSAYRSAPAQVFDYEGFPEKRLSIFLFDAAFRGENGKTRHEVYYGFPLGDIHFNADSQTRSSVLAREVTVRNSSSDELYHDETILDLSLPNTEEIEGKTFIGQVNFELPNREENPILHISISDPRDERLGLYYYELHSRDFTGPDLLLSDLKFSYKIMPSREGHEFVHNGLRIEPHIASLFDKKRPVQVYFEVYNLAKNEAGETRCRIEYSVQRDVSAERGMPVFYDVWGNIIKPTGNSNFISLSNDIATRETDHFEYTTFDLSGLKEGAYSFTVTVTDLLKDARVERDRSILLYGK